MNAIKIGMDVCIGPFAEIIALESVEFSSVKGRLDIGDRVVIGKGANIRAAGGEIEIAEGCLIAQNVSLIAANHLLDRALYYRDQPWDSEKVGVSIQRNVWIGANVVVLPGVHIGENAVIAAGAVVTRDVPANQIWAGVPARYLRDID